MELLNALQGSDEWHQHRRTHFNASDAPAMLGISPYKTRTKLLDEMATGITPEVDEATQRRFADGHRFEALARPLAETIIGRPLYPVIGSEGKLSASFDGLTSDDKDNFEHKSLNDELRSFFDSLGGADNGVPPDLYLSQIEQQGMVSDCERTLFMASKWDEDGNLIEERHCWVERNYDMRQRLMQGWMQFSIDLETHQPKVIAEKPKAEVTIDLPALFVHAKGEITTHNMDEFGTALTARLSEVRAIALVNDQDFSNAKEAAKKFRETAKAIAMSKEQMLAQTETIGEAARKMDAWAKDLNATALQLEKDVEREDKAKKEAIVNAAALAFRAHIEAMEAETHPIQLTVQRPNFAEAIKGKRNYASMQDAVDTMLANAKISADAVAKDVRAKLTWCKENAAGHSALFPDLQVLMTKPMEDFMLTIASRIKTFHEQEQAKLEAERDRIRQEEEAKARAKIEAEAKEKTEKDEITIVEDASGKVDRIQSAEIFAPENQQSASVIGLTSKQPRPTDDQIIAALTLHFRVHESKVIEWLLEVDLKAAGERMAKEFA